MAKANPFDVAIPIPISIGGTGESTRQAALNALADVSSATTGQTLIKNASGDLVFETPLVGGEQLLFYSLQTTTATTTNLASIDMPADETATFTIWVSAKGPSNKNYWAVINGGVRRDGTGNAVLVGTPSTTSDDESAAPYVATVDTSGAALRIRITGAAETVDWSGKILFVSDSSGEELVNFLPVYSNDYSLKWRNAADDANLNALKINSNDHVELGSTNDTFLVAGGTSRWRVFSAGDFRPVADDTYNIGDATTRASVIFTKQVNAGADNLFFYNNSANTWRMTGSTTPTLSGQASGGFFNVIGAGTADGNDNCGMIVMGGGATAVSPETRGAYVRMDGNETSTPGIMQAFAGGNGNAQFGTLGTGEVQFWQNNQSRWYITTSGHLYPTVDQGYDLGSLTDRVQKAHTRQVSIKRNNDPEVLLTSGTSAFTIRLDKTGTADYAFDNPSGGGRILLEGGVIHTAFTATHKYELGSSEPREGDAVKLINRKIELCTTANDPSCIGVFTGESVSTTEGTPDDVDDPKRMIITDSFGKKYDHSIDGPHTLHFVASLGDSHTEFLDGVKVCDEGGAVNAGDFLCTSSIPGFLMKQADDLLHSYTVAQAIEDVEFDMDGKATGIYAYLKK